MRAPTILVAFAFATKATADTGDDFSNNLFSDIAPLLALFGEQFAKQFMSQSMTYLDHIVFAMAPLGILTAIVAAIRVGGPSWLRAVIGRARENRATVEVELMSSTSHEVCELWNGQGVIRTTGKPEVEQIIYLESLKNDPTTFGLYTLDSAKDHLEARSITDPLATALRSIAVHRGQLNSPCPKISAGRDRSSGTQCSVPRATRRLVSRRHTAAPDDEERNLCQISNSAQDTSGPSNPAVSNQSRPSASTPADTEVTDSNSETESHGTDNESAPNISLNLHGGSSSGELCAAALCGIVLQLGMLVFCGFSVYHPTFSQQFRKNGRNVQAYAYPMMAIGTIILSIGMVICSAIVETSTKEDVYAPKANGGSKNDSAKDPKVRILWLQKSHVVSDQKFDSFVIFGQGKSGPLDYILTSRRNDIKSEVHSGSRTAGSSTKLQIWATKIGSTRTEFLTVLGVFLGLCGFILQFEGLRGMNWSASIAQLVCLAVMTIWRAWVRRGLIAVPIPKKVPEQHEMDWLSLRIAKDDSFWPPDEMALGNNLGKGDERLTWKIPANYDNIAYVGSLGARKPGSASGSHLESNSESKFGDAQKALNIRRRLGQLTNWVGPAPVLSIAVADSIEAVMNTLFRDSEYTEFTWPLKVNINKIEDRINFRVDKRNEVWEVDATHLEAALSLWLFHIYETTYKSKQAESGTKDKSKQEESGNDWLRKDKRLKRKVIRLLGCESRTLQRDIKWWVGDEGIESESEDGNNVERGSGFVVGFVAAGERPAGDGPTGDGPASDGPVGAGDGPAGDGPAGDEYAGNGPADGPAGEGCADDEHAGDIPANNGPASNGPVGGEHAGDGPAGDRPDNKSNPLTVASNVLLESSLAQHIFSSFMWAIANEVPAKKLSSSETSVARRDLFRVEVPETLLSLRLENKPLVGIANAIQQSGLCSLQEAYMCIIPPLSHFQRLPMDAFVEFVRQRTRDHEILGRWEVVVPVYINLFQECRASGTGHHAFYKVTAILINILLTISNTLKLQEEQKREGGKVELRKAKQKISDELEGDSLCGIIRRFGDLLGNKEPCLDRWKISVPGVETGGNDVHEFFGHDPVFSGVMTPAFNTSNDNAIKYVKARDVFDRATLHYAVVCRDSSVVHQLLKIGADPNATDLAERTPLHYAIGYADEKELEPIVSALLAEGADTEMRGKDGMGSLHYAAQKSNRAVTGLLLQAGSNPDIQDNSRKTPLHWATYTGSTDVINLLLLTGAYGEARDDYGRTPLHLAVLTGGLEAVKELLINENVKCNSVDRDNRNVLHFAAMGGDEKVINHLLGAEKPGKDQKGYLIPINSTDNYGSTPLDLACVFAQQNMARIFSNEDNKENMHHMQQSFYIAVIFARPGIVELIALELIERNIQEILQFARCR